MKTVFHQYSPFFKCKRSFLWKVVLHVKRSHIKNMLEKKPRSQVSIQPSGFNSTVRFQFNRQVSIQPSGCSTQIKIPTFLSYKHYCLIDAFLVEIISLLCFNSKFDSPKGFLAANSDLVLKLFIFGCKLGNKDILCVLL